MKHLFTDKLLEKIVENPDDFIKYMIAYTGTDHTSELLEKFSDALAKHGIFK
jgi:hypothetical protein